jgi:hypothetical protein
MKIPIINQSNNDLPAFATPSSAGMGLIIVFFKLINSKISISLNKDTLRSGILFPID